jgi:hypothetical protein
MIDIGWRTDGEGPVERRSSVVRHEPRHDATGAQDVIDLAQHHRHLRERIGNEDPRRVDEFERATDHEVVESAAHAHRDRVAERT